MRIHHDGGDETMTAERFFYDHAGYSHAPDEPAEVGRRRCARDLARAEAAFKAGPYGVAVEPDPSPWDGEEPYDGPLWVVSLWRLDAPVNVMLGSLGSVACEEGDPYLRVVAAELALEHLPSTEDSITPEQHVAALCMPFSAADADDLTRFVAQDHADDIQHAFHRCVQAQTRTPIPDVLYAVSARVERWEVPEPHDAAKTGEDRPSHWTVELPTFYLDSRVQGIKGEDHAREIVERMLHDLGHAREDVSVQVSATLVPCEGRG